MFKNQDEKNRFHKVVSQPHVRLICKVCDNMLIITMTKEQMKQAKQNGFDATCPQCLAKLHVRSLSERFGNFFNTNFYLSFKHAIFEEGALGWNN